MGDVERGTVRPTPELQARLRVDPRVRLHWVRTELLDPDGKPAMLATTWQRGASERNYSRTICELRPHQMTSAEAAALGLPRGTAALLVERSRLDGAGFPVQVADLVLPADRWRVCLPY
jgi:GntR family transcriptional regulator